MLRDDLLEMLSNLSQALRSLEGLEGMDVGVDEAVENIKSAQKIIKGALEKGFPSKYSRDTW